MAHVLQVEKEEEIKRHVEEWKKKAGIKDDGSKTDESQDEPMSWKKFAMKVMMKPYVWIFASVLVFSPYGAQMLDMILKFAGK